MFFLSLVVYQCMTPQVVTAEEPNRRRERDSERPPERERADKDRLRERPRHVERSRPQKDREPERERPREKTDRPPRCLKPVMSSPLADILHSMHAPFILLQLCADMSGQVLL